MSLFNRNDGFTTSISNSYSSLQTERLIALNINAQKNKRSEPVLPFNGSINFTTNPSLNGIPDALTSTSIDLTPTIIRQGAVRLNGASPITLNVASASDIIAAMQATIGDTIDFAIYDIQPAPPSHTVIPGAGVTLIGSPTISSSGQFALTVTNNTIGTKAVLMTRI